jgi:ribose transport system ATP-binding protein
MRDGRQVGVVNICDEDEESIVAKMVGRKIDKLDDQPGNAQYFTGPHAEVRRHYLIAASEVLNPQHFVLKLIAGIDKRTSGTVSVNGNPVKNHNVRAAIKAGS